MTAKAQRQCRLDLRLSQLQRTNYERAADLTGLTMTQWVTRNLDESAKRDISEATTTILSPEAFDAFCEMLNAPLPEAVESLMSRKAVWE